MELYWKILLSSLLAYCLFVPRAALAADDAVSVKDNEIFYKSSASAKPEPITADGKDKCCPSISPDRTRVLYQISGNVQNKLDTKIVLLSVKGKRLWEKIPADTAGGDYRSAADPEWIDNNRIGVDCHINPSASQYIVMNAKNGAAITDYIGFNFVWSPDRKLLAHVGLIVHFSYPLEQSYTLEFNKMRMYPPEHGKLGTDKHLHEFDTAFAWSRDSKSVAFVDTVSQRYLVFLLRGAPARALALKDSELVHPEGVTWSGKHTAKITYSVNWGAAPIIRNVPSSKATIPFILQKNFKIDSKKKITAQPPTGLGQDVYSHELDTEVGWSKDGRSAVFVDKVSQRFLIVAGKGIPAKVIPLKGNAARLHPGQVDWLSEDKIRIRYSDPGSDTAPGKPDIIRI